MFKNSGYFGYCVTFAIPRHYWNLNFIGSNVTFFIGGRQDEGAYLADAEAEPAEAAGDVGRLHQHQEACQRHRIQRRVHAASGTTEYQMQFNADKYSHISGNDFFIKE